MFLAYRAVLNGRRTKFSGGMLEQISSAYVYRFSWAAPPQPSMLSTINFRSTHCPFADSEKTLNIELGTNNFVLSVNLVFCLVAIINHNSEHTAFCTILEALEVGTARGVVMRWHIS